MSDTQALRRSIVSLPIGEQEKTQFLALCEENTRLKVELQQLRNEWTTLVLRQLLEPMGDGVVLDYIDNDLRDSLRRALFHKEKS